MALKNIPLELIRLILSYTRPIHCNVCMNTLSLENIIYDKRNIIIKKNLTESEPIPSGKFTPIKSWIEENNNIWSRGFGSYFILICSECNPVRCKLCGLIKCNHFLV